MAFLIKFGKISLNGQITECCFVSLIVLFLKNLCADSLGIVFFFFFFLQCGLERCESALKIKRKESDYFQDSINNQVCTLERQLLAKRRC